MENKMQLETKDNFILWSLYETLVQKKNFIINIIDNGIIEKDIDTFKLLLGQYVNSSDQFANYLFNTVNQGTLKTWNIDFISSSITYELEGTYDICEMALGNLNLVPEFQDKIRELIKEVI